MAALHIGFRVFLLVLFVSVLLKETQCQDIEETLFEYGSKNSGDTLLEDFASDEARKLTLPFNISYFGSSYNKLFISKDGLLSFDSSVRFKQVDWSEGSVSDSYDKPFIAPFFHNGFEPISSTSEYKGKIWHRMIDATKVDGNRHESDYRRLIEKMNEDIPEAVVDPPKDFEAKLIIVVTWEDVTDVVQKTVKEDGTTCGDSSGGTEPCKSATFQAVIVADAKHTFAIFNYKKMEIPITLGNKYQAGFNGGSRRGWNNVIPCQEKCLASLDASSVNQLPDVYGSDVKGRFILTVGQEVIIRGGCLPSELTAGTLEVFPREIGMFGGELLQVSGKCRSNGQPIHCRFSYHDPGSTSDLYIDTMGKMRNGMKGFCPVPIMKWKGPTMISWSSDGLDWSTQRTIVVVLPSRTEPDIEIPPTVKAQWYSRDAETITVMWKPESFSLRGSVTQVQVNLLGYREDEEAGEVQFDQLQTLGTVRNGNGQFQFNVRDHRCKKDCEKYEQGLLEVTLREEQHSQATERVAVRYGPIPLGWYVNEEMTEVHGSDWSDMKCREWNKNDSNHVTWNDNLLPCPCSLDQALADFGRFQADDGCNLFTGSTCHYHKGAKHCVRSVVPSSDGAGNQCCYREDGTLKSSQLSYQGSTPDRSHVWGAHPYGKPNHVPSLSHWKHDVVSFYYCCLWNEYSLCDLYMEQRPTADCKNYDVPGISFLRGDPHITTFDQSAAETYHFGGRGDFWLLQAPGLDIQGHFSSDFDVVTESAEKQNSGSTGLTMLAIEAEDALPILVWPAPQRALKQRGLDIHIGTERHFFYTKSTMWQDFTGGLSVVNNAVDAYNNRHDNFTILLSSNVGINVVASHGLLHVTVALPPNMKHDENNVLIVGGLLGTYDGKHINDFTSSLGVVTSTGDSKKHIYENFAVTWKTDLRTDLFKNPDIAKVGYEPYFDYSDIPTDSDNALEESTITSVCQDNQNCRWDYRITGNRLIAMDTKDADKLFAYTKSSANRVDNCGLPSVGRMAIMDSYNFSAGRDVTVEGCDAGRYMSGDVRTYSCIKERVDIAEEEGRATYGIRRTDESDKIEYIIHWVPRPEPVCMEDDPDAADLIMIIGIAVGAFVVVLIIILVICLCVKNRKSGTASPNGKKRNSGTSDPAQEEAMLGRGPVYKPSREPVQQQQHVDDLVDEIELRKSGHKRYQASNV